MKKLSLLFILASIGFSVFAQKQKLIAQSQYDYKKFHFGMALDFGYYNLVNDYTEGFLSNSDVLSIETESDFGMGVSFILPDLRLGNKLNLRHILTVKTIQRNIKYTFNPDYDGPTEVVKKVESWFVESAIHLKYRADRINNSRVFVFLGPSFGVDMASEKDVIDENAGNYSRYILKMSCHVSYNPRRSRAFGGGMLR